MARVIFHYPRPVPDAPQVGSQVRVAAMLEGFRGLGADVTVVDGFAKHRVREMRRVARAVRRGDRFDAVYSEFTTMPTMLADEHHLPAHPVADMVFFRQLRTAGAGVGMFYRDVYWRFTPFRDQTSAAKRWPALAAYRFEAAALRHVLDRLFVPSRAVADHVPGWRGDDRVVELPPGSGTRTLPWEPTGMLRLLYVGSVQPPVYDVSTLVEAVLATETASLTICCPERQRRFVAPMAGPRVRVVHEHGTGLVPLYQGCDVSCVVFNPDPYRELAMPIKLFESVGFGRPLLGTSHDRAGRYIAARELGWAPGLDDLHATIARLAADPTEVGRMRDAVVAAQPEHTWTARCQTALDSLLAARRPV